MNETGSDRDTRSEAVGNVSAIVLHRLNITKETIISLTVVYRNKNHVNEHYSGNLNEITFLWNKAKMLLKIILS
jgi:hypothetical protein